MNPLPSRIFRLVLPATFVALVLGSALAASAQGAKKQALVLESVKVEPASPKADTLCQLSVTLRNTGDRQASAMEFAVKVNGRDVRAYKNRLFLQPIAPGATREVRLLNFWSNESGRPLPADGKLAVEVTLARASWMGKEAKDGADVWTPLGLADGLPFTHSLSLTMMGKSPR
ncbi:MAG TPA: CARDB domain-containing protein [Thermoanaerobaculia bacterium]